MKKGLIILSVLILTLLVVFFYPLKIEKNKQKWIFYDQNNEVLYSEKQFFSPQKWENDFLKKSLIALEDQNFYHHLGVDFSSLIRAGWQNLHSGKTVSGASTISMQLSRLLFLPQAERNYWYKIRQIFYALKIDWQLSKEEILTRYLEEINFGNGVVGISSASQKYFAKNPANLSVGETVSLLAIIQNPANFNPISSPENNLSRRNFLLKRLAKQKLLTTEEVVYWKNQKTNLNIQISGEIIAPHFIFWVRDQLANYHFSSPEVHIYTTLDKKLYKKSLKISREIIKQEGPKRKITNSSVVVLDQNNNLKVMLGGIDFFNQKNDGEVNLSTATRQTGSTLKPFLYTFALDQGFSPLQGLRDEKTIFSDGYFPRNFHITEENGLVRFREALANSYNISAVNLLERVGQEEFYNFCQEKLKLGFQKISEDLGLAMILGSAETSLINLTKAYSAFTHQGKMTDITFFREIRDEKGHLLAMASPPKSSQVFSLNSAEWAQNVLSDNQARWKDFSRGNSLELPFATGAKTGTSQEFKDNWVVGFSPNYTAGVWVGNNNGSSMFSTSGLQGAGPIWHKVMEMLHPESRENFTYQGQRKQHAVCRRPNEVNCSEKVKVFTLPNENTDFSKKYNDQLRIVYPSEGDIFYKGSDLLIQTRGIADDQIRYFLNSREIFSPIIKNLPSGNNLIEVKSGNLNLKTKITVK